MDEKFIRSKPLFPINMACNTPISALVAGRNAILSTMFPVLFVFLIRRSSNALDEIVLLKCQEGQRVAVQCKNFAQFRFFRYNPPD
ncbi:MAG: hypothetical protein AUJ12_04480 [Alphaproteobacteria bacterium CG1_02_46_17]|nr:MAG: hypothetical protein AUJ12_04480 [Alphaproteobacteria bacterium CG1_02_46_17]